MKKENFGQKLSYNRASDFSKFILLDFTLNFFLKIITVSSWFAVYSFMIFSKYPTGYMVTDSYLKQRQSDYEFTYKYANFNMNRNACKIIGDVELIKHNTPIHYNQICILNQFILDGI